MRLLVASLALLFLAENAWGGMELPISLQNDGQAKISVGSSFDVLPPAGYAPIEVKINNQADRAQTWTFAFGSNYSYGGGNLTSVTELTVERKAARSFKLIVPLPFRRVYYFPLGVRVSGPGSDDRSTVQFPGPQSRSGHPFAEFIGMSESLAVRFGGRLEEELKNQKHQLAYAKLRATELPDDWRTLVGFSGIWLTGAELDQLSPSQRGTLDEWITRGGKLFICDYSASRGELRANGFGQVSTSPSLDLNVPETAAAIRSLEPSLLTQLDSGYASLGRNWHARVVVGDIELNVLLLIGLMTLFAVLAGPVNLFFFAPSGRRQRLFWTIPAISIFTSILLCLLIVLQDGFGGSGLRIALIYLLPGERKQIVLQEQLARTGVVLSSRFETAEAAFIAPIKIETEPENFAAKQYENVDRRFGGEWFKSRSLQAHWIESVAPTRAEVALLNGDAVRDGGAAPVILSSISAPLEELYFCDEESRLWWARNVHAGEKIVLHAAPQPTSLLPDEAGPRLRAAWEKVWKQPGHFYASSNSRSGLIDTLKSIRWHHERVIYVGAVSSGVTPP